MAKGAYIGIDDVARKIKGGYIGVDGVARKITKAYIGVDGVARLCWEAPEIKEFHIADFDGVMGEPVEGDFNFEDGMTWEDWLETDYNTIGLTLYSEDNYYVYDSTKSYRLATSDGVYVLKTDLIWSSSEDMYIWRN